jgi:hypothetical protein
MLLPTPDRRPRRVGPMKSVNIGSISFEKILIKRPPSTKNTAD